MKLITSLLVALSIINFHSGIFAARAYVEPYSQHTHNDLMEIVEDDSSMDYVHSENYNAETGDYYPDGSFVNTGGGIACTAPCATTYLPCESSGTTTYLPCEATYAPCEMPCVGCGTVPCSNFSKYYCYKGNCSNGWPGVVAASSGRLASITCAQMAAAIGIVAAITLIAILFDTVHSH